MKKSRFTDYSLTEKRCAVLKRLKLKLRRQQHAHEDRSTMDLAQMLASCPASILNQVLGRAGIPPPPQGSQL